MQQTLAALQAQAEGGATQSSSSGVSSPQSVPSPRQVSSPLPPSSPCFRSLGPLPKGWDQAVTDDGEVYFINHEERTTTWFDPRIPQHLQQPQVVRHAAAHLPPTHAQGQQQAQATPAAAPQPAAASPLVAASAGVAASAQARQSATQLRLEQLQREREVMKMRQEEIRK
ncbi:unnamed protein product, partial [Cyprideis torosa]